MTGATLTIEEAPHHAPGARQIVVDCDHGTTTAVLMPGGPPDLRGEHERASVALAIGKHYSVEKCSCTKTLRARYGLARAWP